MNGNNWASSNRACICASSEHGFGVFNMELQLNLGLRLLIFDSRTNLESRPRFAKICFFSINPAKSKQNFCFLECTRRRINSNVKSAKRLSSKDQINKFLYVQWGLEYQTLENRMFWSSVFQWFKTRWSPFCSVFQRSSETIVEPNFWLAHTISKSKVFQWSGPL